MSLAVTLLTSVLIQYGFCTLIVDPNGYQYEVETLLPNDGFISYPDANPLTYQQYQPTTNILEVPQIPEQRNIRQSQPSPPKVPTDTTQIAKTVNSEINDLIDSLNRLSENRMDENQEFRATDRADDYGLYHRPSYGYPPSPYGPWSPSYGPQSHKHEHSAKLSLLKPDLLVKPVATKAASKVGGLVELGLALLTGSADTNLPLNGFKDIVINGIVKPLLTAKGSLKSLVSKLSIPLISILLINLEVLITIWWLWEEDCPKAIYHAPVYSYPQKPSYHYPTPSHPPSYNYNSYR